MYNQLKMRIILDTALRVSESTTEGFFNQFIFVQWDVGGLPNHADSPVSSWNFSEMPYEVFFSPFFFFLNVYMGVKC